MSELSPDRTAKITRAQRDAVARGRNSQGQKFVWPAPPNYDFSDEIKGGELCVLAFTDGQKTQGALLSFVPEYEVLKFLPEKTKSALTIAFSALLSIKLPNAVGVRRQSVPESGAMYSPSDRQPFFVRLVNGTTLEGETVGHVHALCGLFLFLPEADDKIIRCFVPASSAQESRIGRPIGEMLVEERLVSPHSITQALEKQKLLRARKLGEYLTTNQIVSPEQLAAALKQQGAQPVQKLGESLVELGFLTRAELEDALAVGARDRSIPLGQILVDMGIVDSEVLHGVMAKKLGIPVVNLRKFQPSASALKRIPAAVANRYQIVPLVEAENALVVAVENPMNMERMEEVRFIAGSKLIPVMAPAPDIKAAIELAYGPDTEFEVAARSAASEVGVEQLTMRLSSEGVTEESGEQQATQIDSTLVKLVNKIVFDAVEQKASDIHIEAYPGTKNLRVRFRKDGALVSYLEIPAKFRTAVISRIKIMSQLDITERRKPQDGKINFHRFGPLDVELRVATIPTLNGLEDVVMRVLVAAMPKQLDELGFDAESLAAIKRLIARPHGLFLVCGPTGSGKTTTLHSLLGFLNKADTKIWTAEDPIEITQAGLRQVQMNPKIGWTFAAAMRSFMRADPDVIMVGEMRDSETAKIGIEASLTGHLVLSTLHTNSAAESVVRLLDLGMDPFNFADALLGVLSQRLVRKLCTHCRAKHEPSVREIEELATEYCVDTAVEAESVLKRWRAQKPVLYLPKGCEQCDRTGYSGRIAVYELMVADAQVKRLIQKRSVVSEVAAAALANGMRTLKQDGIEKVLAGHTDMTQVRAV
ncbi:MAG TPA: ATPase, T2SS/T4P/T4SS family [Burkholderiales bacterium]|nr:ATPase, T2SS/T4P/T4SS family [Burkholderiales bacterium]